MKNKNRTLTFFVLFIMAISIMNSNIAFAFNDPFIVQQLANERGFSFIQADLNEIATYDHFVFYKDRTNTWWTCFAYSDIELQYINDDNGLGFHQNLLTNYRGRTYRYEVASTHYRAVPSYNAGNLYYGISSNLVYHSIDFEGPQFEDVGVPLKFRYYTPSLLRRIGTSIIGSVSSQTGYFAAQWDNVDSNTGFNVQIQYKGIYDVKKDWVLEKFSPYETFESDWIQLDEIHQNVKEWYKQDIYVDFKSESPILINLEFKSGYDIDPYSIKLKEGVMRIRYVQRNTDGYIEKYGNWVSAYINEAGANSYVTDDDGTIIDSEEYGQGYDYSSEKIQPTILKDIGSSSGELIDNTVETLKNTGTFFLGIPAFLGSVFPFLPGEVSTILIIGFGALIALKIFHR